MLSAIPDLPFLEDHRDYWIFLGLCLFAGVSLTAWLLRSKIVGSGGVDRPAIGGIWVVLMVVMVPGWFLVERAGKKEHTRLRSRIEGFAPTYAEELSTMGHSEVTAKTLPEDSRYLAMISKQIRWLELNPGVADIYTFRRHPDGNELIVDSETDYDRSGTYEGSREARTEIGEVWNEFNPAIMDAFAGNTSFDEFPYSDRWGTWVSAYVPMMNEAGEVDAILGVDYPAEEWLGAIGRARMTVIGVLAFIIATGLSAGLIISILRANLNERRSSEQAMRRSKKAVDAANEALAASNRDLEQFAYVASHDLQEPLRMVTSFLQLLQKRYGGQLDNDADEYIRQAVGGAERMRGLIRGLLELARVNRAGMSSGKVEAGTIVAQALKNLSVVIEESGAEVTTKELPRVFGNEAQLIQLFQNLVSNAIKFCQKGSPVINISARPVQQGDETRWIFSLSDNGPGIEEEHHQRIYQIFKRLDSAKDIKGTGIGLALCRRIVELHGGEIKVDSAPGEGSVFRFDLPGVPGDTQNA
tara:strand:+ start:3071 stop:4651 length:1581 start_codon:yes stop_codon:yes gene_type:complete